MLGLSTRKGGDRPLARLGRPLSLAIVSALARQLDAAARSRASTRVLLLGGIVLKRQTGAGVLGRAVLVALGLRLDGKK